MDYTNGRVLAAVDDYKALARSVRKTILEMSHRTRSGHVGSAFSMVEILTALYFKHLAVSPDGKTLYFVAVTDPVEAISTNADVYAVPLAGGEPRRITAGPGWDGSPRPSPDGTSGWVPKESWKFISQF